MSRPAIFFFAITLLATGCATSWSRQNATYEQFDADRYACLKESKESKDQSQLFEACMRCRGYKYEGLTTQRGGELVENSPQGDVAKVTTQREGGLFEISPQGHEDRLCAAESPGPKKGGFIGAGK